MPGFAGKNSFASEVETQTSSNQMEEANVCWEKDELIRQITPGTLKINSVIWAEIHGIYSHNGVSVKKKYLSV